MKVHFYKLLLVKEPAALYSDLRDKAVTCSKMVFELAKPYFEGLDREQMLVFALNIKNKISGVHLAASGTVNACYPNVREIFKFALGSNAVSIILAHNHPAGDPGPSSQDTVFTKNLIEAGRLLDISLLDHVIIGDGRYFSCLDHGLLSDLKKDAENIFSPNLR